MTVTTIRKPNRTNSVTASEYENVAAAQTNGGPDAYTVLMNGNSQSSGYVGGVPDKPSPLPLDGGRGGLGVPDKPAPLPLGGQTGGLGALDKPAPVQADSGLVIRGGSRATNDTVTAADTLNGGVAVNTGEQNTQTGNITYDTSTGMYHNLSNDSYWKNDENGNTVYVDSAGNPLTKTATETTAKTNSNPFISQENSINSRYDSLAEAAKLQLEQGYQKSKSAYEQALIDALPEYQKQREQQDLLTQQNAQKLKEYAFYTGDTGGMSRQDALQNMNSGMEALGAINLQEQLLKDNNARTLADLLSQKETNIAISFADFAAQKEAALESERIRLQESNASWQQWLTEQTGYMQDGSKTLDRLALEYDMGQATNKSNGSSSNGNSVLLGYGTSANSSAKYNGSSDTGAEQTDTALNTNNPYSPTAYYNGDHAQYYVDETTGKLKWQPYYTRDDLKTTPEDYMAPSDTDDPVSWIINSAASYDTADGAEISSPVTSDMKKNLVMSYVGANYNDLPETEQKKLLNYYGLTEDDLLAYFADPNLKAQ